ncbi:hypothetical protein RHSIM_Rhsim02G0147100 [Rhododendron simsii]|uniref:Uncharacterized protein n=1 Tax=Rhododendron simsii TaxID=118357 RepID=A0A834HEB4_RHOSS|nr:hypothetical protein RHSIM_Rhsim02G0147100 [Rhododendron simsii]
MPLLLATVRSARRKYEAQCFDFQTGSKDRLLEPFLGLAVSTSTLYLDLSFDRLLESRPCDLDQNDMIERAMKMGFVLLEARKRSARKHATMHNAVVWALPPDLTTKIRVD